jgi:hypothetical protein
VKTVTNGGSLANMIMNLKLSQNAENFLTNRATISFSHCILLQESKHNKGSRGSVNSSSSLVVVTANEMLHIASDPRTNRHLLHIILL